MANLTFFQNRLGEKLEQLKTLLDHSPVVLFFLAKKNAGKGTYAKLLNDITDNRLVHISVGDLVREAGKRAVESDLPFIKEVISFYDTPVSEYELMEIFKHGASQTQSLLPTPVIIALIKRAMSLNSGRSIIIDGFPRGKDQAGLSIKMKNEFKGGGTPSAFVEIDCADEILLARLMDRRICPNCQTPKHIKLLLTEKIDYEPLTGEFHLICDRPECGGARMIRKQGDADGPEVVKERQRIMAELFGMVKDNSGGDYLVVKNHVPVSESHMHHSDDFTTSATLLWDDAYGRVVRKFDKWVIKDEYDNDVYSRWPEPVVADLASVLYDWLIREKQNRA